jgi:glycine/D-amino acid oxidase-like deaminating enzyme
MSAVPRILIIGAGSCGLGCARELMSLGHENWLVFERASVARGHAGSVVDPQAPPEIASMHVEDLGSAYPVPTIKRDAALTTIQSWLMAHDIYSRGRFGAWKYEIGNMDHSVKMGIDIARFMVKGIPEEVWS